MHDHNGFPGMNYLFRRFPWISNGRADGWTDGQTDGPSHRAVVLSVLRGESALIYVFCVHLFTHSLSFYLFYRSLSVRPSISWYSHTQSQPNSVFFFSNSLASIRFCLSLILTPFHFFFHHLSCLYCTFVAHIDFFFHFPFPLFFLFPPGSSFLFFLVSLFGTFFPSPPAFKKRSSLTTSNQQPLRKR